VLTIGWDRQVTDPNQTSLCTQSDGPAQNRGYTPLNGPPWASTPALTFDSGAVRRLRKQTCNAGIDRLF
jgi:hypothetical protein